MRSLLTLVVLLALGYCVTAVPIGAPRKLADPGWPFSTPSETHEARLTFAGHVRAIWHTEELQDLKNGLEDQAGPALQDLKHEVHKRTADDPTGATRSGSGSPSGSAMPVPAPR